MSVTHAIWLKRLFDFDADYGSFLGTVVVDGTGVLATLRHDGNTTMRSLSEFIVKDGRGRYEQSSGSIGT